MGPRAGGPELSQSARHACVRAVVVVVARPVDVAFPVFDEVRCRRGRTRSPFVPGDDVVLGMAVQREAPLVVADGHRSGAAYDRTCVGECAGKALVFAGLDVVDEIVVAVGDQGEVVAVGCGVGVGVHGDGVQMGRFGRLPTRLRAAVSAGRCARVSGLRRACV